MNEDAKSAVEVPIWQRADQTLNDMREALLAARDEAERDGNAAGSRIAAINDVLSRIQPPLPQAVNAASNTPPYPYQSQAPGRPRTW
jgi:hypothetical protein